MPRLSDSSHPQSLGPWLVLMMAVATGISVASLYYAQPLLNTIATEFTLSPSTAGSAVTASQLSYGIGLLLLVPLGDLLEKRALIVTMCLLSAGGLLLCGLAPDFQWLLLGTAIAGLFAVAAQIMIPFAATLAAPEQRGRVIGTLMSGLLLGILLARTAAGAISSLSHWRVVYLIAAALMTINGLILLLALPKHHVPTGLSYARLIKSVGQLMIEEPVLRLRAFLGMTAFSLFGLFWTTLAFLLARPPYEFSDATIGLVGLTGIAGAVSANMTGRLADRGKGVAATRAGLLGLLLAWLPLGFAPSSLAALLIGILILDCSVQLVQVSNQSVIYKLRPQARNRMNAGYMTCYFMGGAAGSTLAAYLFEHYDWAGIVSAGAVIAGIALATGLATLRASRNPESRESKPAK
jgi:predicted MFS family arabinose efflux permease